MGTPLALRVDPQDRETLPSFLSRMAAVNGTSVLKFCSDMGVSYRGLINLNADDLKTFAELSALTEAQIDELVSWTGQAVGDVRMRFRDEIFVSRALRNPTMRGCPACLKEDFDNGPGAPSRSMVMRGDWQLRDATICVRHGRPLVDLWHDTSLPSRMNIGAHLDILKDQIGNGAMAGVPVVPSPYDRWLDARLASGTDDTWLFDQPLYAATTFIRLLGKELVRQSLWKCQDLYEPERAAQAAGFDVVRRGPAAIRDALERLAARAPAGTSTPNKAFGQLYRDMARAHLEDELFKDFRAIMRKVILDTWPIASGEDVLGESLSERRLYAINAAAQDAGIGPKLMGQLLVEAGALNDIDMGQTFPAGPFRDLIAEIPQRVGNAEMCKAMGATRHEFEALATDGAIAPRTKISTIKAPWLVSDGMTLIEELDGLAIRVEGLGSDWERLIKARARAGLSFDQLLRQIRKSRMKLAKPKGEAGFSGFHVLKSNVDALKTRHARANLSVEGLVPAAVFARQIGLRDGGKFLQFLEAGHSPSRLVQVPNRRAPRRFLDAEDIAAFRQKFVTPTMLMEETGLSRNTILANLRAEGAKPFRPDGQDFGNLFPRSKAVLCVFQLSEARQREFSF
ncbi:TniQ family protein [Donghicola eburneus]|uniref:TniQ family protein n=1 Tax=Donghicola eburneus TaxID=393278 RepID=UPI0008E72164|nr:TniQ family protein [Donghicola eburneus]SFQ80061.1 TniQ protein [Donghicola eburneus]